MNRFCLDPDGVVALNARLIDDDFNVLDRGKLESALAAPLHTFGGRLLNPSTVEQAAVLLTGLVKAHAFSDGNKRTAWVCTATYVSLEGLRLKDIPGSEVADFVEAVAVDRFDSDQVRTWLYERISW